MHDERGSAAVESLAALSFAFVLVTGGLLVGYAGFARSWLDRTSYEASICLASDAAQNRCESRFRDDVIRALPFGHLDHLALARSEARVSVHGTWSLSPDFHLPVHDERELPLRRRGER